jgi:hypothetical protein
MHKIKSALEEGLLYSNNTTMKITLNVECLRICSADVLFQGMATVSYGLCILLLVTIPAHIIAYKSGAPETVCDSMVPEHHSKPKSEPSPYTITLTTLNIKAGESLNVTLSGNDNTKFRGYFIQARVGNTPIGKFEQLQGINLVNCGGGVGVREASYFSIKFLAKAGGICDGTMTLPL